MFQDPYSTNPALRAVKAKDASPSYDTLIIHHLSDPHYGRIGNEVHPLERYKSAIARLPEEKQPHLIIITGDLTLTGTREELREAAIHIRGAVQATKHQQRVFIVPGPHDIDWSNPASVDSFESLRASLQGVILPSFLDRNGASMSKAEPYVHSMADNYLVYLINTCMTPESAPRPAPKHIEELHKQYRAIWREFLQKSGGITTDRERQEFLKQTLLLIDRDLGYIARAQIDSFANTLQSLHLEDPHMALSQPG
ncbi:MAG TPA: metallophosphoesterase, partial [Ktedonobacterales bacterium]|nr:metallophosphoesterase [Ktedonobacterales bacterium]